METKALLNFTYGSIAPKDIKNWLRKSESKLSASELKKTTNTVLYNEVERDEGQDRGGRDPQHDAESETQDGLRQAVGGQEEGEGALSWVGFQGHQVPGNIRAKFTIDEIKKKTQCKACASARNAPKTRARHPGTTTWRRCRRLRRPTSWASAPRTIPQTAVLRA